MRQLSIELLEQLDVICEWILEKQIQIPNRDTYFIINDEGSAR